MLGQRVNNYEIVCQLGEGGMGTVYEAKHPLIDRRFAIKVLKAERLSEPELVQRFFNEARTTSAIRHPNIVEIIDVGTLPGGAPYLVMELLEGETLSQRLERMGKLELSDAFELARQTASALQAAHERGIVHRDLKPENLFLVPDRRRPGRELVKVLDFGIAKLRQELPGQIHTMDGVLLGTPPYMSPEQCRGVTEAIDHRTDVYALGVILYEIVCGRLPFEGEGMGDTLLMHMSMPPPPPTRWRAELPAGIERVILRALAKRPEDRFASMAELRSALEPNGAGVADSIAPPPSAAPPSETEITTARMISKPVRQSGDELAVERGHSATIGRSWRVPAAVALLSAVLFGAWWLLAQSPAPLPPAASIEAHPVVPAVAQPAPLPAADEPTPSTAATPTVPSAPPEPAVQSKGAALSGAARAPRRSDRKRAVEEPVTPSAATASFTVTPSPAPAPPELPHDEAPAATGYLSLDSSPWAEVYLGSQLLGTTPLMRVQLPAGKHVLTLRNPELDQSTSYAVEIEAGATVSRLVGWNKK